MSDKEAFYLLFLAQFYLLCDVNGWGESPLTFVYNLEKKPEEKVTEEEFIELLTSGAVSLPEFAYLLNAVKGDKRNGIFE